MPDARKFSRKRREIKLNRREAIERELSAMLRAALREHDPTAPVGAVNVIAELLAAVGSQLLSQTQVTHRALRAMKDDIADYGAEFVVQLVAEAKKDAGARVRRATAAKPSVDSLSMPDDWAGPVAGPTLIETQYGIPRSTLYRWQKRGEAIAIQSRTSRKPVFPLKQFVDGHPVSGLMSIVEAFGNQRSAWAWLVSPCPSLDGREPIEVLLLGGTEQVVALARGAGRR